MRLIDADSLIKKANEEKPIGRFTLVEYLRHAPTAKATVFVAVRDRLGNEICGFLDITRNLVFTDYGVITLEMARQKQYTIINLED